MFGRRRFCRLLGASGAWAAAAGCHQGALFAIYNWGDYLAPGLLERFAEREVKAGHARIRTAQDFFLSELELLSKLRAGDRHDIVVPIDYLMTRMAREGLLHPLNTAALPGLAHLSEAYPAWRTPEKYRAECGDHLLGVPYFWGVTGIGYDSERVDPPPTSWNALFDPKYAGRISVLDSKGDVFDQAQLAAGLGINSTDKPALREVVYPKLVAQRELLRAYDGNPSAEAEPPLRRPRRGRALLGRLPGDSEDLRRHRPRPPLHRVPPRSRGRRRERELPPLRDAQPKRP